MNKINPNMQIYTDYEKSRRNAEDFEIYWD